MIHIDPSATGINESAVAYRNVLSEGALNWSSETPDGFAANALGPQTFDFWTPAAMPATLGVALDAPVACDCAAIIAHTLGSAGATVQVQRAGASRTNLALWSGDLTGAGWAWGDTPGTIEPGGPAPDGQGTMWLMTSAHANTDRRRTLAVAAGGPCTISIFTRRASVPRMSIGVSVTGTGTHGGEVVLNPDTGAVVATASGGGTVTGAFAERVTDDIWRIGFTLSWTGANTSMAVRVGDGNAAGESAEYWGLQVEAGSVVTSYIPTTSAAVTSAWHDVTGWVAPDDDSDLMLIFGEQESDQWRILITGPIAPHIGIAWIGPRLIIPEGVTPDYTPLNLALNIDLMPSVSVAGQFLGTRVTRTGAGTSIQLAPQERWWIETEARPFIEHYNAGKPFLWASCPELLPDDMGYCWRSGNTLSASYGAGAVYGNMSMEVSAYHGR